jgi:aminoglycoside phosphotransferase (APT) family kinase protein
MDKLHGDVLRYLKPSPTTQETSSAYARIGQVLRELHRIAMAAFGYIGPDGVWTPHSSNYAYMSYQFDKKLREFPELGESPATTERVAEFVDAHDHLLRECASPVLCHNNLHSENVLVTRDATLRVTGIVDFVGALAGDPLMDVARALYHERSDNQKVAAFACWIRPYGAPPLDGDPRSRSSLLRPSSFGAGWFRHGDDEAP